MNTQHIVETKVTDTEIIVSRLFDFKPEAVFDAWSKPEFLKEWFGPDGFTLTTEMMDFTDNGEWIFTMHAPDGTDFKNYIQFTKIERPKLITYNQHGADETEDIAFNVKVTFEEIDNRTKLTLRTTFPNKEMLEEVKKFGAVEGGQQTLNRLNALLEKLEN